MRRNSRGQSIVRAAATDRLSCYGTDPAWVRPAWRWRWRSTRRARASDARSATATKETSRYPYLPFVEIIESNLARAASLDDYRRRMGDTAAELAQIAPSLRRVFPDLPQPLELPAAQQRGYLFQSVSEALAARRDSNPQLTYP